MGSTPLQIPARASLLATGDYKTTSPMAQDCEGYTCSHLSVQRVRHVQMV